jgi:ribosomal protein S18 acetylase RimI-like enzyme
VAHLRSLGIEQWDPLYPSTALMESDLRSGTLQVLRLGGAVAGCVTMDRKEDPLWMNMDWDAASGEVAAVHRLMVHPTCQGRGLGKRLMLEAEALARTKGFQFLRLDAFLRNPASLALYDRLGYRRTGTAMMRKGPFVCFEKLL